ncbi:MAG TPA: COP23 domain-containing protein [Allocoleopsis sp.]
MWKSAYFNNIISPEERCKVVTKKFQEKYESGNLTHLKLGKANGYSIICGVKNIDDPCDKNSQLFTLKSYSNTQKIKQVLDDIMEGSASEPLWQSSGNSPIPLTKFGIPTVKK